MRITQKAREREPKGETAARGPSISLRFYPKKARPVLHALGLRFTTQQFCFPRNKTSPVTYFHPAATATNIRHFSTSTAEEPAALGIQEETLHRLFGATHAACVLSEHIFSVLLVPASTSSSLCSPSFTAKKQELLPSHQPYRKYLSLLQQVAFYLVLQLAGGSLWSSGP